MAINKASDPLVLDDLNSGANGTARVVGRAVSRLFRQMFHITPSPLTCGKVKEKAEKKLLSRKERRSQEDKQKIIEKKIKERIHVTSNAGLTQEQGKLVTALKTLEALGKIKNEEENGLFRDWLRKKAVDCLTQVRKKATASGRPFAECLEEESERKWVFGWLWAVDRFPYPLWISFTTYLRRSAQHQCDFERWVWPVLLETMGGSVSAKTPWTLPFNRCKLFVRVQSLELASDIYDREALTRMMAGFYRGLRLGSIGSLCILFLSSLLFYLYSVLESLLRRVVPNSFRSSIGMCNSDLSSSVVI